MNYRYIITGSKDCSIKCLSCKLDEYEDEEESILFSIEKAHADEVNYIMKVSKNEIISCGKDGIIKRWFVNLDYYSSFDFLYNGNIKTKRFELLEAFPKVHRTVNKIIKMKNGVLCSCGSDYTIRFWKKNNSLHRHENYKTLKCKMQYVQAVLELDNDKIVAGEWHLTQNFLI